MSALTTPRTRRKAFTLLELIISCLIFAVLATLLVSASGWITERSRSVTCTNRLRQIGILYHLYVAENNRQSRLFVGGEIGMGTYGWYNILRKKADLNTAEAQKAFGCPSLNPDAVSAWFCYGFRSEGAPGKIETIVDDAGKKGDIYHLHVATVEEPSQFLMIADTAYDPLESQSFRFLRAKEPKAKIHLRHADRANGVFLDGHIRALDMADLHAAGIVDVYDKNGTTVKTKP